MNIEWLLTESAAHMTGANDPELVTIVPITPGVEYAIPARPLLCYCCGAELSGDRVLLCPDCSDPNGFAATVARKYRRRPA